MLLSWIFPLSFLIACADAQAVASVPAQPGTITKAHIVSRAGDAEIADDSAKRARADEGVELFLAIEVEDGGARRWHSDAGTIRIGKKKIAARPIAEAPAFEVTWRKIEPTQA